ncbi:MAG: NADP-dependent isocitrate dehydrogenase [Gammaproteobacteria bacterium]|nr:NADP-dependent isocitrate dehydrogenase [Gammaproteobacteria bacterium]
MELPEKGEKITRNGAGLKVPDQPVIPFIRGDGIGRDIWRATERVLDAAVAAAYDGKRQLMWMEIYAGESAFRKFDSWLPDATIEAIREYRVAIKGPLTTPVGGGIRSLNVAIRQMLDLYVCLRPVRWFEGVPSPVRDPGAVDMVIFRENTEDIYAGAEFEEGEEDTQRFLSLMREHFPERYAKVRFPDSSGVGLKPVSREGSQRLMRAALDYALAQNRRSVTLVHKGNIMKYTEGAFRNWAYDLAENGYGESFYTWRQWDRTKEKHGEQAANAEQKKAIDGGAILVKDAIADIALQQVLTRAHSFDVIATTNLNGDYLSDALAAQVGGIGIAPGGNINGDTGHAVFEATHGTAPKYADKDMVNPGSLILSGEMMLRHLGWNEAADKIIAAMNAVIADRTVTYDFHRLMEGATKVKCSEFGGLLIASMQA